MAARAVLTALLALALPAGAQSEDLSMARKAALFQHDMEARFLLDGQALCKLKLPAPQRDFTAYNMPDNAYMTGIYLGTLAMKYAVTRDPADKAAVRASMQALHHLCTVSGVPGLLARAAWPASRPMDDDGVWRKSQDGAYLWRGDVSSDQINGLMFGVPLAYDLVANEEEKTLLAADVCAMVDHIVANALRIVGHDGTPTQWGKYDPEYVRRREPMNALLWLQLLQGAAHMAKEECYTALYRKWALDEGYAAIAVRARRTFNPALPGLVNYDDDMSMFLAYATLLRLETDPELRRLYLESLRRSWEGNKRFSGTKPQQNPFFTFIAAQHLEDRSELDAGINTLRWFPLDMKWNRATIAKYETQFTFTYDPAPKSPEPEKGQVIPIDRRVKMWSAWVEDPYHTAGQRDQDAPVEYNGHDYQLAYWTGRYLGFIPPEPGR